MATAASVVARTVMRVRDIGSSLIYVDAEARRQGARVARQVKRR
jgi:hypothetical protein